MFARIGTWQGLNHFMPHENTRDGVTSTITESDSSSAASVGYCGYFA